MRYLKNEYTFIAKWAKKLKAVNLLGGSCFKCGNAGLECLCFHHPDDNKENSPKDVLQGRWSEAVKELIKCKVSCHNCHAEIHTDPNSRASIAKTLLLKTKRIFKCQECDYAGENYGSLDFHHLGEKSFNIRDFTARRQVSLEQALQEIEKCMVVCKNCHMKKQINMEMLNKFRDRIVERATNAKEKRPPLSPEVVFNLFDSGVGVVEIGVRLDYPKSTVSAVLKKALEAGRLKFNGSQANQVTASAS